MSETFIVNPQIGTNDMQTHEYIRKPFAVEAIQITNENIEQLSSLVGTLKHKEDGTPYIAVDRKKVPSIYRVDVGYWLTRMGDNVRCYAPKIFEREFTPSTPDLENWMKFLKGTSDDTLHAVPGS